ncbi:5-hydroxytryptamine receptor 4 isoform X1 [Nomascus leucogenys]|uniref:5-hydroxytryptamine receptor 4 n=1 Tax=Nomascus leucogenys TaxID=61853 RepID=A0A2I3GRR7_NOMLE|nr:5-hydroxytryptamine receptor 4 isoform X1 [Nomascus leucogenys]
MDKLDANVSSEEGFGSVEKVVLLMFLSTVILMAILGNLLVMVAVCWDRQLRKIKTNYFIVSLAFADLLVSVLVMPFGAIELVQDIWIYGEMFCLVRTSLDVLLTTASIFHLCCISLDRYYAICCQPLVYRNKMTPLRIALMLGGCWVIPTFISFLPIMQGWNNIGIIDLIEKRKFNQNSNSTYCVFMVNKPYAITCSVVAFYIPFLLMVLAYYRIYVTAKEHAHQIQMLQRAGASSESRPQSADQHSTHRMRTETKAAKTLCIIMGCFCLCWAPFFVTNIVDPFIDYTVPGQVWTAFLWLGYINSGLNPFLYAFLNKSFRRAFLIILCCDDERYRRPSILGQTVPCSTTTINGSTHVLRTDFLFGRDILARHWTKPARVGPFSGTLSIRCLTARKPVLGDAVECGGQWESQCHPPATSPLVAAQPSDT